jgi:hypothetical protein
MIQYDTNGDYEIYGPIYIDNTTKMRRVVRVINLLGQEATASETGMLLEVYCDGTTKKIIR